MKSLKTYIIHVRTAIEREKHMQLQLINRKLDYRYVLDGDQQDLNPEVLKKYFTGSMQQVSAMASCAFKHFLAYESILADQIDYALILEDDIYLNRRFDALSEDILTEVTQRGLSNFLISLEDSNLKYVRGSQRKPGQYIYKAKRGRMAGAYLIDKVCAENILVKIQKTKCHLPVDWFHNFCSDHGIIDIYWSHPTVATQGSLNGKIKSMIDKKPGSLFRIASFRVQRVYKKLMWKLK